MTELKLDKVLMTSLVDGYINYDTLTTSIALSGNVPDFGTASFIGSIIYSRGKTRADLYVTNLLTGVRRPLAGGFRQTPYQAISTETCEVYAEYSGLTISIEFFIQNNSGAPIAITPQTMEVSAVLYEVPY
jgi:hypothetical protein